LTGLGACLITAPAIVHAGNIMRVRPLVPDVGMLTFGPFPNEPRIMGLLIYDIKAQGFIPKGEVEPVCAGVRIGQLFPFNGLDNI
jgi:hypothetical protein